MIVTQIEIIAYLCYNTFKLVITILRELYFEMLINSHLHIWKRFLTISITNLFSLLITNPIIYKYKAVNGSGRF